MGLDYEATDDGAVVLMLTATDASGNASEATAVTVTVTNVNEPPTLTVMDGETPDGMSAVSMITENMTGPVGAVHASDPEQMFGADDITVDDPRFSIKPDAEGGLWLELDEGIDADTEDTVTVELELIDDGGLAVRTNVTINIVGVNEVPTVTVTDAMTPDGKSARAVISEGETGPVGLITVTDQEEKLFESNVTLSDMRFGTMTDAVGGIWLVLNEAADYETDGGNISVTVTVTDSDGLSAETMVDVAIVNVNEAPTITVMDSETPEGMPAVSVVMEHVGDGEFTPVPVGEVMVSDPEQDLTEADITVHDSRFGLHTDDLGGIWLMLNEGLDADGEGGGTVTVKLTVADAGSLMDEAEAAITVSNVNEMPTIMLSPDGVTAELSQDEEAANNRLARIMVSDPEGDLTEDNISLSDGPFGVETDAVGAIWLTIDAVNFEEVGKSLSVTVTVTDSDDATAQASAIVTINDVNDAPEANQDGVVVITKAATDEDPQETEVMVDLDVSAGGSLVMKRLDLGAMFDDEDGDTNFSYHLENAPAWLSLVNVQYGKDGSVVGELSGTVPAGLDKSAFDVRIVARDEGDAEGFTLFNVIVDDGNDRITGINLINEDGSENTYRIVDIPENEGSSGFVLGTLTADDQDDPRHPNGRHTFEVAPAFRKQFEIVPEGGDWVLRVRDDAILDHEAGDGSISVSVTAKDGGGSSFTQTVIVNVEDNNDAPTVKNMPGNWWVTVDDDLDADEVKAGQWLTFNLEVEGDQRQLFEDEDSGDANKLTFSIVSGPAWLEIDGSTLQNVKETLPTRGIHTVTLQATDADGESDRASFEIAVVLSDENNADNSEPDIKSDGMDITEAAKAGAVVATITVEDEDLDVAGIHPWGDLTIVVEAFADLDGNGSIDEASETLQSSMAFTDTNPNNDFLALEMVRESDDSVTYNIVLKPWAVSQRNPNRLNSENYDEIDLRVTAYDGTVTVAGATAAEREENFQALPSDTDGMDVAEFDFEVEDVNEAPVFVNVPGADDTNGGVANNPVNGSDMNLSVNSITGAVSYSVMQQQDADEDSSVHTIYLNLSRLFEDPDEDHQDDDNFFSATISNEPWLKVARLWNEDTERFTTSTTGVVQWKDIKDGRDEDPGNTDDVAWGPGADNVGEDDWVLILEVDRTGNDPVQGSADPKPDLSEIGQDENAVITIVARDDDGESKSQVITVTVTDENLHPGADGSEPTGVRISDTTPHEKQTITISFNENVDPDFTGDDARSPVVVITQVINIDDGNETVQQSSVGDTARYTVKQTDVGDTIQGKAIYFEVFGNSIVRSLTDSDGNSAAAGALETTSKAVADRQDVAVGSITLGTTGSNAGDSPNGQLVATISVTDKDGFAAEGGLPTTDNGDPNNPDAKATYIWEYSDNGRGGWKTFDADGSSATPDAADTASATIPVSGSGSLVGKHVRLRFEFEDSNGERESIVSESVQIGSIATIGTVPVIDSGGQAGAIPVGRTLRVDLDAAKPAGGTATAEWIFSNASGVVKVVDGDEAKYTVTEADRGMSITVRVTSKDKNGNVVSIVTTAPRDTVDIPDNSSPIAPKDEFFVNLGAAPAKEGQLAPLEATVNMANLFEDVEGGLMFGFAAPSSGDWTITDSGGGLDVYYQSNGDDEGDQLLIINEATGEVHYYTTMDEDHDGSSDDDGNGNWITSVLMATDPRATDTSSNSATVNVHFRIDLAPEGFEVGTDAAIDPTDGAGMLPGPIADYAANGATLPEEVTVRADKNGQTNSQIAARIDVQDDNQGSHVYGEYTLTVDDERFEVVPVPGIKDGSQGILRLKTGQSLDFEDISGTATEAGDEGPAGDTKTLYVIVTATPDSGNFDAITLRVAITVTNKVEGSDPTDPNYGGNTVPGLRDNEANDADDETDNDNDNDTVDDDEDGDEDGGTPAPMDAMATFAFSLDGGLFPSLRRGLRLVRTRMLPLRPLARYRHRRLRRYHLHHQCHRQCCRLRRL